MKQTAEVINKNVEKTVYERQPQRLLMDFNPQVSKKVVKY